MNERIRELAKQAGASFVKGYIELSDGQLILCDEADADYNTLDLEKFAELIVQECAEVAYDTHDDFAVKVSILEHFGVKE